MFLTANYVLLADFLVKDNGKKINCDGTTKHVVIRRPGRKIL